MAGRSRKDGRRRRSAVVSLSPPAIAQRRVAHSANRRRGICSPSTSQRRRRAQTDRASGQVPAHGEGTGASPAGVDTRRSRQANGEGRAIRSAKVDGGGTGAASAERVTDESADGDRVTDRSAPRMAWRTDRRRGSRDGRSAPGPRDGRIPCPRPRAHRSGDRGWGSTCSNPGSGAGYDQRCSSEWAPGGCGRAAAARAAATSAASDRTNPTVTRTNWRAPTSVA